MFYVYVIIDNQNIKNMMSNRKTTYTAMIDVDSNAVGFVLGKGRHNLNNLKSMFPDVKIWITQNGPLSTFNLLSNSINRLEQCKESLEKLKYSGESVHQSIVQRKRITKNIESQRQNIIASKKIRDSLENEMRSKHRDEVQKKIVANLQNETIKEEEHELPMRNMFSGLEIE